MTDDRELLKKRFTELANRAYNSGIFTFTSFLGLAEQSAFAEVKRTIGAIPYTAFGGAEGCERVVIRFGSEEDVGYEMPFPISVIKAEPTSKKFAESLTHRDFLGSIMNLGIERSTIGDIFVQGKSAYVYCNKKMEEFFLDELDKVKHTNVKCRIVEDVKELPVSEPTPQEVLVSSVRVDGVIAKVYNISRSGSLELFRTGRVFINGKLMENNSYMLKEGDSVTARGFGKFTYVKEVHVTKKDKVRILIEKY